jgi:hypothetical protein
MALYSPSPITLGAHYLLFELEVSACERPQTYALDSAATGNGFKKSAEQVKIVLYVLLSEILFLIQ